MVVPIRGSAAALKAPVHAIQAERYNSAAALNYPALSALLLALPLASCIGNNGLKLAPLYNDLANM